MRVGKKLVNSLILKKIAKITLLLSITLPNLLEAAELLARDKLKKALSDKQCQKSSPLLVSIKNNNNKKN